MPGLLKALRLLGDESRLRMLRLLEREELSVAELQEILGMGQSRISMALSQLRQADLVETRRAGQKSLYRFIGDPTVANLLHQSAHELAETRDDDEALRLILKKRKDRVRSYFDELAGRFGKDYVPGRSWKGLSEMLIRLLPPMRLPPPHSRRWAAAPMPRHPQCRRRTAPCRASTPMWMCTSFPM